jgi:hypothetical protein
LNPQAFEGSILTFNPNFNQLNPTEYARGREELAQFMKCQFVGLSMYIKKTMDSTSEICYSGANPPYSALSTMTHPAHGRLSFCHDLYVSPAQLNSNNVTIDTVAGSKRNISKKGTKVYQYKAPKHLRAGFCADIGTKFPSAKPSITWPDLLSYTTPTPTGSGDISIPANVFYVLDSVPPPVLPLTSVTNISYAHTCAFEVFTYYYFNAFGKRSNL